MGGDMVLNLLYLTMAKFLPHPVCTCILKSSTCRKEDVVKRN